MEDLISRWSSKQIWLCKMHLGQLLLWCVQDAHAIKMRSFSKIVQKISSLAEGAMNNAGFEVPHYCCLHMSISRIHPPRCLHPGQIRAKRRDSHKAFSRSCCQQSLLPRSEVFLGQGAIAISLQEFQIAPHAHRANQQILCSSI